MKKEYIENYVGEFVKITLIDNNSFEGILWFVCYEDEKEENVHSINIDSVDFSFLSSHIKSIEKFTDASTSPYVK
jgi:hypothetical protein